jgi:hypothetical protein
VFDQLTVIGDAQIGGGIDIGDISADVIEFGDNGQGGRNKLPVDPPSNGQVLKANTATGEMEWGDSGLPSGDVTITGNLTVEQNLQVDGQIISEMKIEDAILESNVGGLDSNNSGWMANGDANTLFSGLIRDGTTKKFHLFNAATVKPTPAGAPPTPDGDLVCRSVLVEQIEANDLICGNLEADSVTVGDPGVDGYQLPAATGTADQFLTCDGAGATAWTGLPISSLIRSPDGITFAQANDGVFVADSEGTEFINATPLVTTIRGGGVENPNIVLRSGFLSSYIQRNGRDILNFSGIFTRVGFDGTAYDEYASNLRTARINSLIRERLDLNQHVLSDAATVSRIGYDATKSYLGAPTATSTLELADASLTATLAGQQRLNIDAAGASLSDSVGQARLSHEATLTTLTNATGGTFLELGDTQSRLSYNGINAIDLQSLVTRIRGGPAGFSELQLGGMAFGLDYRFNSIQRIKISGAASQMFSPDAQGEFDIRNDRLLGVVAGITRLEQTSTTNTIADASGVDRVVADVNSSRLIAPSGGNKLDVAIDGITSSGAFVVTTTDINNVQITSNAPPGQAAALQQWNINAATVAQIDNQGNGTLNNLFLGSTSLAGTVVTNTSAVPMIISPSTATKIDLGYNGIDTLVKSSLTMEDSQPLALGNTSSNVEKPVSVKMVSNAILLKGQVLKIVNAGGVARVSPVLSGDPNDVAVFGVSLGPAVLGGDVDVAIGGLFEIVVERGATVNIGDTLEKSNTLGQDGRVLSPAVKEGAFAIALTGGTGDIPGTVRVLASYLKSEFN